jgi:hypothetical protein
MTAYVHAAGQDSDGCIPCWEAEAFDVFPAIPEGPWCKEPTPDDEMRCTTCSHFVDTVALPMTGECE